MNNPEKLPLDIEEQRQRLLDHKEQTGLSWSELAKVIGSPSGTLSSFGGGTYTGRNENVAEAVFKYFQHQAMQAEIKGEIPDAPGFIETETARKLISILTWAQRGRLNVAAMGPGTSKTITAEHYRDCNPNVWLVTLTPSLSGINTMQIAVMQAMGQRDARGTPQALSQRIMDVMRNSRGLLIIDEAQHVSEKAVEEIRSWHDNTGCGIAFLGNDGILNRFEGGSRRANFAQLYSRISYRHIQALPTAGDVRALVEAWGIYDKAMGDYLTREGRKAGGMRNVTRILELAMLLATGEGQPLSLSYLTDAWAQLSTRPMAA